MNFHKKSASPSHPTASQLCEAWMSLNWKWTLRVKKRSTWSYLNNCVGKM